LILWITRLAMGGLGRVRIAWRIMQMAALRLQPRRKMRLVLPWLPLQKGCAAPPRHLQGQCSKTLRLKRPYLPQQPPCLIRQMQRNKIRLKGIIILSQPR
jgi:hypothetical protein